jgi:hypothetical protein
MKGADQRKITNKKKHSKPGAIKQPKERKKHIVEQME